MKTFWRISNRVDLDGNGGKFFASRWTSRGQRVVFMAESPAGALLEVLVHLGDRDQKLPPTYTLLEIEAPDELAVQELNTPVDPEWKDHLEASQAIGDRWLASRQTVLARVPSALVPRIWNLLLNPEHADAPGVKIASVVKERFDIRLFQARWG